MDTLQAAYLVCVAVHLALWLYGHLRASGANHTS
jgi:hypothetical protein